MKKVFISLIIISVIIVIGCSENVITDPTLIESVTKVNPGSDFHGIIPIENLLNDPYPVGNSFYKIIGQIEYRITEKNLDQNPAAVTRDISINLELNADLQNVCTMCPPTDLDELSGFISELSDLVLPLTGSTVSIFDKSFTINGRTDKMTLNVKFSVSHDRVDVTAMWLALPKFNTEATRSN